MLASSLSYSQNATIEVNRQGQVQAVTVSTVLINDVVYLELPGLIEQMGGAHSAMPRRMRIDLEGTTAWVGLNDNRVNALTIFSLSHNIVSAEEGIFIALNDCEAFFNKAFRLSLSHSAASQPTVMPDTLEPEMELAKIEDGATPPPIQPDVAVPTAPTQTAIRTILLDAGHGGYESGVESPGGVSEKDIVLSITQKLQAVLRDQYQLATIMTRESDGSLSTQQRNQISRATQADLLISIHAGGAFSEATSGFALFYSDPAPQQQSSLRGISLRPVDNSKVSYEIAEFIAQHLSTTTSAPSRGIHSIPNAMLSQSSRPSLLIEVGCLTNTLEEAKLRDEAYQMSIAEGIAKGVQQYLERGSQPKAVTTLTNSSIESEISPL